MAASRAAIMQPLLATSNNGKVDLNITVAGGGETGQSGAIRHAISRVLVTFDETTKPVLKKAGFLTRDSRMVERKKYGKRKARRGRKRDDYLNKKRRLSPEIALHLMKIRCENFRIPNNRQNFSDRAATYCIDWRCLLGLNLEVFTKA